MQSYVNKCVQITWLMAIQDPPVSLHIPSKQRSFDKKMYRYYTEVGEEMAFVVWPPMVLHDGGAILMKGVAEGRSAMDDNPNLTDLCAILFYFINTCTLLTINYFTN